MIVHLCEKVISNHASRCLRPIRAESGARMELCILDRLTTSQRRRNGFAVARPRYDL